LNREADATQEPTVVVAALAYKRPDLLETLLTAFAGLRPPKGARAVFLIVDNDDAGSARATVEAARRVLPGLRYVIEGRKGIPVARNRALDEALAIGADALCFIDDDEYPDVAWLDNLVACWKSTGLQLIGGPVVVAPAPAGANAWQRFINDSLAARAVRRNRSTARAAAAGRRFTVVTNNWLCDLAWQRGAGVRFDERLLVSGGSDTAFFRAARLAGCRTGWCPEAVVLETSLPERLSMAYQFRRAASQSMHHFAMKAPKRGVANVASTVLVAAMRAVLGLALLVVPVFGIASPVIGVRSLGWSLGRIQALRGGRSTLYE